MVCGFVSYYSSEMREQCRGRMQPFASRGAMMLMLRRPLQTGLESEMERGESEAVGGVMRQPMPTSTHDLQRDTSETSCQGLEATVRVQGNEDP